MTLPKKIKLDAKKLAAKLDIANEQKDARAAELVIANEELAFQNTEKDKRAAEFVIANEQKENWVAELVIANEEKAKRVAELVIANEQKDARAAELVIANEEKEKRAAELLVAKELVAVNFELEIARDEANIANKAKSEFLAAMSHDLRTPLNAIMGFSDMIRLQTFGPLGDPHYEDYANDIHNSGSLLVSLINDVLDLSKVEAGKYDLIEEPLDIPALVAASFIQLGHMAVTANQTLSSDIRPDFPSLLGDERVMIQVLNNLLSNAIKFTPLGGAIRVVVEIDENNRIVLSITDTGMGMSNEGIVKALKPFEQADGIHTRRHQGTGLGLHLCTNFMKLFGGTLSIQSEVDKGTTVTLKFPPERTILSL